MKKTFVVLAIVLTSASGLKAEPLTLVENGQPRAAIVVAAGEPKAGKAAAEIAIIAAAMVAGARNLSRREPEGGFILRVTFSRGQISRRLVSRS